MLLDAPLAALLLELTLLLSDDGDNLEDCWGVRCDEVGLACGCDLVEEECSTGLEAATGVCVCSGKREGGNT